MNSYVYQSRTTSTRSTTGVLTTCLFVAAGSVPAAAFAGASPPPLVCGSITGYDDVGWGFPNVHRPAGGGFWELNHWTLMRCDGGDAIDRVRWVTVDAQETSWTGTSDLIIWDSQTVETGCAETVVLAATGETDNSIVHFEDVPATRALYLDDAGQPVMVFTSEGFLPAYLYTLDVDLRLPTSSFYIGVRNNSQPYPHFSDLLGTSTDDPATVYFYSYWDDVFSLNPFLECARQIDQWWAAAVGPGVAEFPGRPLIDVTFGDGTDPADLNGDGAVDGVDLGILLANWSIPPTAPGCEGASPCPADINGDGVVDGIDLGILLSNWG